MREKVFVALAISFVATGCAPGPRATLSPTPGGTLLAPDEAEAVTRIAQVRARRELFCLPPARRGDYDVEGRIDALFRATVDQIHPESCKSNVHVDTFAACIEQIRDSSCSVDLHDVSKIEACTSGPLCGPRPNATW